MARLTPERRELIEQLATELLSHYHRGRLTVAIDGPTASGKTTFADDFAAELRRRDLVTFRASIDDFLRPSADRYARGRDSAEGRYRDSYDYSVFRRVLVEPFRLAGSTGFVTEAFDHIRDVAVESRWQTGPADAFLVVDGAFLNRPELRGLWNYSVWLDAADEVRAARMAERDGVEPGTSRSRRYELANELYEHDAHPRDAASAIVDNTDPDRPKRVFADSC
jgi:uridine kinase